MKYTRDEIIDLFNYHDIDLHPAGVFKYDSDGYKVGVDLYRADGIDIYDEMYINDNMFKYRPELHKLIVVDIDDIQATLDKKVFSIEWQRKLEGTFNYVTSGTNKRHYLFYSEVEFPELRVAGNAKKNSNSIYDFIDLLTFGIVFTGHLYDLNENLKYSDNDISVLSKDDTIELFNLLSVRGYENKIDRFVSVGQSESMDGLVVVKPKRKNWEIVPKGGRNNELFSSCCSELACNIHPKDVARNAIEWNKSLSVPLSKSELRATVESAVNIEKRNYPNGRDYSDGFKIESVISNSECDSVSCELDRFDLKDRYDYLKYIYEANDDIKLWFDEEKKKYIIKKNKSIIAYGKDGFKQVLESMVGETLPKGFLAVIPLMRSRYNPPIKEEVYMDDNGVNVVNTFIPSPLMEYSACGVKEIPKNIGKLLDCLFTNEMDMKDLFLNWLAFIYQHRQKSGVAWAFVGSQGTGKGILTENIMGRIFQEHLKANISDTHLAGQFNGYLSDKLIIQLNEISTDYKSRIAIKNKIKTWITDKHIEVEQKGIDSISVESYANFIVNSNEQVPIDIEDGDRRFNVIHTDIVLEQQDWFTKDETFHEMMKECDEFAKYLASYDVRLSDVKKVVMTKRKQHIINSSRTIDQDLIKNIVKRNIDEYEFDNDIVYNDIKNELDKGFISNNSLHYLYCLVHSKDRERVSVQYVKKAIERHGSIGEESRIKIMGESKRGFRLATNIPF